MVDPTNQQELLAALDASARSVGGGIAIARKGAWRIFGARTFEPAYTQRQRHELISTHHQINRRRLEHRSEPFTARKLTL